MFYLGIQSFVENITNINYSTCLMIQPFSRYCPINFIIDILISIQVSCMTHSSLMVPCTFSILFPIDFPTMWSPSCKLVYKPHEPHKYYSSRLSIINHSCWRDKATSLSRGPHIVDFVEQIFLACTKRPHHSWFARPSGILPPSWTESAWVTNRLSVGIYGYILESMGYMRVS